MDNLSPEPFPARGGEPVPPSQVGKGVRGLGPHPEPLAPVVVIGVGNLLLRDEGVGVHVVREIQRLALPVRAIDGGTAGVGLVDYLEHAAQVVFVDAARMGKEPGEVVRFGPEEVAAAVDEAEAGERLSLHEQSLLGVLRLANALGYEPKVTIIGIEPKEIDWGTELSAEVAAAVPRVVELVRREAVGD